MHNDGMTEALPHYALGASERELQRLIALASHEEEYVIDACRRVGVGEGAFVVDVGCGPLGALSSLSRVVGDRGRVVGIDGSATTLEKARAMMNSAGHTNVELLNVEATQLTINDLGGQHADLAYCRLLLMHQADPEAVLRRMRDIVRPGGWVIAHDASDLLLHAPSAEPAIPAMTRVWELVIASAKRRGANPDFARRGKSYLERAGLEVVSHRVYAVHYPPHIGLEIPRVALESLRPSLAAFALADESEIERLSAELEQAKSSSEVQWVSSPVMFEWIARRPSRHAGPR